MSDRTFSAAFSDFRGSTPLPSLLSACIPITHPRITTMRSQVKLYEHPEFKMEEADLSLLSTICFVLSLALVGALFIAAFSCVLLWDDCISSFATYGSRPHLLTVQQVLRG